MKRTLGLGLELEFKRRKVEEEEGGGTRVCGFGGRQVRERREREG